MAQYIIIGNGVAGNTAADNIRKNDPDGKILIFSKEKYGFYYVPALPEYLAGEKDIEGLTLHNEKWYKDNNIDFYPETEVTSINVTEKAVVTSKGKKFFFDKLLLATGGYSFLPPIKGSDNEGVFSLRSIDDANRIMERAKKAKDLVLIGGGLLGLEAGNGLRKVGLNITVVEFFPRLLPRQMDTSGASVLQSQMEDMGFTFYLGAKTESISREGERLCVNLEGGEKIESDIVLISAGVRPEVTLAKALGLEIDKGVKVDDRMKTGIKDIYAAGDLIEHRERFYGIWPAAMEQGRVAGINMAGGDAKYEGTVPANSLKVVGISLTTGGEIDADGKYESILMKDDAKKIYRKLVLDNDILIGAILFGDDSGSDEILRAIKNKKEVSSFKDELGKEDFDFKKLK